MSLKSYQYDLPFSSQLDTSRTSYRSRKGLLLEYSDQRGTFYGEAAPLESFAGAALPEVIREFKQRRDVFAEMLGGAKPVSALRELISETDLPAPLDFGMDTLAHRLEAYEAGTSLADYLFDGDYRPKIAVNALGDLLADDYLTASKQRVQEGYQTIKYKIGRDFSSEFKRLRKLHSEFPKLTIRLDANQAWSLEEAVACTEVLESLNIEYCEEPLSENSPQNFEELARQTAVPLAIDESLHQVDYWPNLLPFTSFTIIKPMMIGPFKRIIETKRLADTHDNRVVITTSLESGIGRQVIAELASGLGAPEAAHGLDTGSLFAKDLHTDKEYIYNGCVHIDEMSSDISIDPGQLNQLATLLK